LTSPVLSRKPAGMDRPTGSNGVMVDGEFYPNPPLRDGEAALVDQFRVALEEERINIPDDEWMLVRFLRARGSEKKRDIPASVAMLGASLQWRHSFGTDDILYTIEFPEKEQVASIYPVGYFNTTKSGIPVYIERYGALNLTALFQVTTLERLMRMHVFMYEEMLTRKLPACTRAYGSRVVQGFSILDLDKCSMGDISDRKLHKMLGNLIGLDQNNYPEMLNHMFIINAPSMFTMAWRILKTFVDPNTARKVHIHGRGTANYLPALLEYVDLDKLPTFLGGTYSADGWPAVQPGPWQDWMPPLASPHKIEPEEPPISQNSTVIEEGCRPGGAFVPGIEARSCVRHLGGSDGLLKTSFKRKMMCKETCSWEVLPQASRDTATRSPGHSPRHGTKSAREEAGIPTTVRHQYFDSVWGGIFSDSL